MVDFKPKATSTIQFTPKSKGDILPKPTEERGFLGNLVMSTGIPRVAANLVRAGQILTPGGYTAEDYRKDPAKPVKFPLLGDVKPIGQEGTFAEKLKDTLGESLKAAATVVPIGGSIAPLARTTLAGRVLQGAGQGLRAGAAGGALYGAGEGIQEKDATIGSVALNTAIQGTVGGIGGSVLGGAFPAVRAGVRTLANLPAIKTKTASNIMQRVARVNALDQQKFQQMGKESIGEYLTKRGIYGNDEDIMQQLATRFQNSKNVADDALATLKGNFKPKPVETALNELAERELRVSSPGAPSQNIARVTKLAEKFSKEGLTMSEINEVKRIYERTVKLDYLKQRVPDMIERSNNIDRAILSWQVDQADKLGFTNLRQINKETQLAKELLNALGKKNARSGGNNAITLTDWIMLSGGDPTAVAGFIAKRGLSSKVLQSTIAKKLAGEKTVAPPEAVLKTNVMPKALPMLPAPDYIPMGPPKPAPSTMSVFPAQKITENGQTYYTSLPNVGLPSTTNVMPKALKNQRGSNQVAIPTITTKSINQIIPPPLPQPPKNASSVIPKKKAVIPKTASADITTSIQKAKASGQSFDEWVKGQGASKLYDVGDSFEMGKIVENPFKEGVPSQQKVSEINNFIKSNKDKYNPKYVKFYHGTAKGLPIEEKGLLPTSATRRKSYQSESGYVYLANTPERAKTFGELGNMSKSDVYEVVVPIDKLLPDLDQLNNIRSIGEKAGNTIGDSIIYGGGVRIKGKIEPYAIRKLPASLKTRSQLKAEWDKS